MPRHTKTLLHLQQSFVRPPGGRDQGFTTEDASPRHRIRTSEAGVRYGAVTPDGRFIQTASLDGQCQVWDIASVRRLFSRPHDTAGHGFALSRNGARLALLRPQGGPDYPGQAGSTYAFYSVATAAVGNGESAPGTPDAQTTVISVNTAPVLGALPPMPVFADEGVIFTLQRAREE